MENSKSGKSSMRSAYLSIVTGVLSLALLSCSTAPLSPAETETPLQRAYGQFQAYLDNCSKTTGTDPRKATGVGERELVSREREWRACAYEGIRVLLVPAARHPELFAQMIAEDQNMTDRIAKGTMTRSERRARLDELREAIAQKEGQSSAEVSQARAERNAELVRQVRGLP
jgi:hypothetical protein